MGLLKEFKEFALKGNMVDLAVGVVIGAAFGGVVKSIVDDVMMPPLGWLLGGMDFSDKAITLQKAGTEHAITGKVIPKDVILGYGRFINVAIQFLIVALAVFVVVKLINSARRKPDPTPSVPPVPTQDQQLLMEIRDLLKSR